MPTRRVPLFGTDLAEHRHVYMTVRRRRHDFFDIHAAQSADFRAAAALSGRRFDAAQGQPGSGAALALRAMYCLEGLRRQAARVWDKIDCLLVPTSSTVATIETMLADPVARNSKFGVYTNFVNLLDLAAVSLPEGMRADRLPSGVTYIAPAFTDEALCAWRALAGPYGFAAGRHCSRISGRAGQKQRPASRRGSLLRIHTINPIRRSA